MTIKQNAPEGATHYSISPVKLSEVDFITYFKYEDGKYFEYFSNHFARYESGIDHMLIKPL